MCDDDVVTHHHIYTYHHRIVSHRSHPRRYFNPLISYVNPFKVYCATASAAPSFFFLFARYLYVDQIGGERLMILSTLPHPSLWLSSSFLLVLSRSACCLPSTFYHLLGAFKFLLLSFSAFLGSSSFASFIGTGAALSISFEK